MPFHLDRFLLKVEHYQHQLRLPELVILYQLSYMISRNFSPFFPFIIVIEIHENNTSAPIVNGEYTVKSVDVRKSEAFKFYESINSIIDVLVRIGEVERAKTLDPIRDFCEKRLMFLSQLSMKDIFYIVKYHKYYNSYRMLIGDCLSKFNK